MLRRLIEIDRKQAEWPHDVADEETRATPQHNPSGSAKGSDSAVETRRVEDVWCVRGDGGIAATLLGHPHEPLAIEELLIRRGARAHGRQCETRTRVVWRDDFVQRLWHGRVA